MNTATRADRALERVQNLYIVQTRLIKLLESDLRDPVIRKETQASIKEFQNLLSKADWRYMGGEEVWESLKMLPRDALAMLRASPASMRHLKAEVATAKTLKLKAKGKVLKHRAMAKTKVKVKAKAKRK